MKKAEIPLDKIKNKEDSIKAVEQKENIKNQIQPDDKDVNISEEQKNKIEKIQELKKEEREKAQQLKTETEHKRQELRKQMEEKKREILKESH